MNALTSGFRPFRTLVLILISPLDRKD